MSEIKNRIIRTTEERYLKEYQEISEKYNTFRLILDGRKIESWAEYNKIVGSALNFPTDCSHNNPGFYDWIRDLSWNDDVEYVGAYVIVIENYKDFLTDDLEARKCIISSFADHILPFWEEEVLHCVVGGETKVFCVYLI